MGNIEEADQALKQAIALEPNDPANKEDKSLMETVLHQQKMISKYGADDGGMHDGEIDYEKAAKYCQSILTNCPLSTQYMGLRIQFLLRSHQLKEADEFSKATVERQDIPYTSSLHSWRARVVIYGGNETLGRKLLLQCLQNDPDNKDAQRAIKNLKLTASMKEQASEAFKQNKLEEAISLFD